MNPLPHLRLHHEVGDADEVLLAEELAVLDQEVVDQVTIQLLEVADEARFPVLDGVEEPEVGFELRREQRLVNATLENVVAEVEDVVDPVVRPVLHALRRS